MTFKTLTVPDWTQDDLDRVIAGGAPPLPPAGTLLSGICLPSDWNNLPNVFAPYSASGYVPYTGATADVDLGTHGLKTGSEIFTTSLFRSEGESGAIYGTGPGFEAGYSDAVGSAYLQGADRTGGGFAYNPLLFIGSTLTFNTQSAFNNNLVIDAGGLVGIGTATPTAQFEIYNAYSGAGAAQIIRDSSGNKIFELLDDGAVAFGGDATSGIFDPNFRVEGYKTIQFAKFTNTNVSGRTIMGVGINDGISGATFDLRAHGNSYSETLFGIDMIDKCAMIAQGGLEFVIGNIAPHDLIFGADNNSWVRVTAAGELRAESANWVISQNGTYNFLDGDSDTWTIGDPDSNGRFEVLANGVAAMTLTDAGDLTGITSVASPTIYAYGTTDSTSLTTGALISSGGLGVAKTITAKNINATTGTISTSNPAHQATQTWNGGGVTFNAHLINITDTSSAAASTFVDYQASGTSRFSVRKDGVVFPRQATTAGAPTYTKGGIYFDTTLNKLRVGGASAWETITSS